MGNQKAAVSFLSNLSKAAFGLGMAVTMLNSLLFTVGGRERAVLFDRFKGVMDQVVGEGTHFLIPWLQDPFIFDIHTKPHTFSSIYAPSVEKENFLAPSVSLVGDVHVERGSSIWYGCVLRDANNINVEAGTNIQDNALVHVAKSNLSGKVLPNVIGDNVIIALF